MDIWRDIQGVNAGYLEELYERYRRYPNSVDAGTRLIFEQSPPPAVAAVEACPGRDRRPETALTERRYSAKIVGAVNLAESIRKFGHLDAQIDPLGTPPPSDPSLHPEFHGVTEEDLRELPATLMRRGRRMPTRSFRRYAKSIHPSPAMITPTCATRKNGNGCGWRLSPAFFALPLTRSMKWRCSSASLRKEYSSSSCTALFPARPDSRSKASES